MDWMARSIAALADTVSMTDSSSKLGPFNSLIFFKL
jgi:hypothetical protein